MKSMSCRTLTGGWNVVTAKNLAEVESLLVRKDGFYLILPSTITLKTGRFGELTSDG